MNRRNFLKSLFGSIAVLAVPKIVLAEPEITLVDQLMTQHIQLGVSHRGTGYKGSDSSYDAYYFYAPYIPLMSTSCYE